MYNLDIKINRSNATDEVLFYNNKVIVLKIKEGLQFFLRKTIKVANNKFSYSRISCIAI